MRIFIFRLLALISLCGLSPLPLASAQNPADVTINALAWSPNGQKIAAASTDGVYVWNAEGTLLTQLVVEGGVAKVAWNPDSLRLALGKEDGYVAVWNVETNSYIQSPEKHSDPTLALAWGLDGTQLMSTGSYAGSYILWEIPSFAIVSHQSGNGYELVFSPDNTQVAVAHTGGLLIMGIPLFQTIYFAPPEYGGMVSVDWRADATQLVSGDISGFLYIWDASTHEVLTSWQAHAGVIFTTRWQPFGQYVASADKYHTIRFWDANTGYLMGEILNASSTFAWSPDGQKLVYAGEHSSIQIIQVSEILS